jgi:hypothetical protein
MNWSAFWSGMLGTTVPGLLVSLIVLRASNRVNRSLEEYKQELNRNSLKSVKWHEKRIESLIAIYEAFRNYLGFLRRALYWENARENLDPMHDFRREIEQRIVYLDDRAAERISRYQGELLLFWNWAITSLCQDGESAREAVRRKLDYEIPSYLPNLRQDINEWLDPDYERRKLLIPGEFEPPTVDAA